MTSDSPHPRVIAASLAAQGTAAYGINDFAQAETLLAQAARLDPVQPGYRCNLATARLAQGKKDLALSGLQAGLDPLEPLDCATMGLVLKTLGAGDEAMVWLRRALLLDPRQAQARINLANLLIAKGESAEAIRLMRTGLYETPGHAALLNNLGLALHESGDLAEALGILEQARSAAPDSREIALNLAHTLLMMGRLKEGFAAYEARPLIPSSSTAPRWQGETLPGKTLLVLAELGMAVYFALVVHRAWEVGLYAGLPFLLLFLAGFLYTGLSSALQPWQYNAAWQRRPSQV